MSGGEEARPPARRRRTATRRRSRGPRRVLVGVGVLALVIVAAVAWLGWQALQARDALQAARPLVVQVQEEVTSGQAEPAAATLAELQQHTEEARGSTHGPLWSLAARLPAIGDDVRAVQGLTSVVDDVARDALSPLVEAAGSLDPAALAPTGGAIDLAPLQEAAPDLEQANAQMQAARDAVQAIDTDGVDARIAGPVGDLRTQLTEAASTTATGARAAACLLY